MNEEMNMVGATEVFEDKTLVCKECGKEFVFSAGEQAFYKEKGFMNEPKSCKACRDAKKNAGRAQREYFITTCISIHPSITGGPGLINRPPLTTGLHFL